VIGGVWCVFSWRNIAMGLLFQCLRRGPAKPDGGQLIKLKAIFYHALYTNPDIKEMLCEEVYQALRIIRGEQGQQQQT
jgi:hypothetical protein